MGHPPAPERRSSGCRAARRDEALVPIALSLATRGPLWRAPSCAARPGMDRRSWSRGAAAEDRRSQAYNRTRRCTRSSILPSRHSLLMSCLHKILYLSNINALL
ncbi:hypothetical protein PVAP13_9NG386573 [Panicum virgatum]|uniref:Uncharacterized protein n=1 Tax=Panicum virgatum TaxID=38727 RepID=A0A8T0MLF9_PANVG|nr:hypothetical protein PVAP13_9NG386573 [Panicum virgatum]